ncbi:hypothetical protein M413DRAFT_13727 [Hebeloma cylindrosporum]|uniref:Uncharacterized protein n=1 Tax=Hebeloma cylindrosporum TaxID=76867 RepID=A0A0C2Y6T2_HEBCY|nr:hypothetical protein M413DRAFT_13727 [Hebeloma cylindrosporum h7]
MSPNETTTTYTFINEGLPTPAPTVAPLDHQSYIFTDNNGTDMFTGPDSVPTTEVVDLFTLNNHFISSPDIMGCDDLSDLFGAEPKAATATDTRNDQPLLVAPVESLEPLFKTMVQQLGITLNSALRDSIAALIPAVPITSDPPVTTDQKAPSETVSIDHGTLQLTNDPFDRFISVSRRRLPRNQYDTLDHPLFRRMKYAVFCLADPTTRFIKTYHAGQLLLFCETSKAIIDGTFHINMISSDYLYFSETFNRNARTIPTKRFATYNPSTGLTTIPDDPITIVDFKLERNLLNSLDYIGSKPNYRKQVNFTSPDVPSGPSKRYRGKRADTPYPHVSFPRNHYHHSKSDDPIASSSSTMN